MILQTTSAENTVSVPVRAPCRHNSNLMSSYAVNAVTGEPYKYRVGTYDTLRLFRVRDSTSTYGPNGKFIKPSKRDVEHPRDPHYLYYDGPKEYMDHTGNVVDKHVIERWNTLQQNLLDEKGNVKPSAYKDYLRTKNSL